MNMEMCGEIAYDLTECTNSNLRACRERYYENQDDFSHHSILERRKELEALVTKKAREG